MKFRTEYIAEKAPFTLSPDSPVALAGSCFSDNISEIMRSHLWDAANLTGTLYNPESIRKALSLMLFDEKGEQNFSESLFLSNEIWMSHLFDSSFNATDKNDCLAEFMKRSNNLDNKLKLGKTLIITFGTSIVYVLKSTDEIVGNCHKQSSDNYYKKRLDADFISNSWDGFIKLLSEKYPGLRIIFTVSPVRHLKDTPQGNSRSKAELILAIDKICTRNSCCHYFPAYEIMLDDLRDYRFYASDLLHPSQEGVEYIWEKFKDTYLDQTGREIISEGAKIVAGFNHILKPAACGKIPQTFVEQDQQRLSMLRDSLLNLKSKHPLLLDPNPKN